MPKTCVGFYISKSHCLCNIPSLNKSFNNGKEILSWLASFSLSKNVLNGLWSLDFNVAALLSRLSLSVNQLQELMETTKLSIGDTYAITYIPLKYFAVREGNNWNDPYAMFFNSDQYAIMHMPEKDTEDFAFKAACEAKDIGQEVYETLRLLKIESPSTLISPINCFMKQWGKKFSFPTIDCINEIDPEIGEYYWDSCSGGWFECFQKGSWIPKDKYAGGIWDYDIRSCYGSLLSTLPDVREGKFEFVEGKMTDAPLGVYKCNVEITSNFSSVNYKTKDWNFTPTGIIENKKLVRQTIDDILQYKTGKVEIIDGYEWRPTGEYKPIFLPIMNRLYELKESNTGIRRDVIKRISNALWGQTGQVIPTQNGDKFGDWVMPLYYSTVENHARSKMFRTAMNNGVIPVAIQMDGMATTKPLDYLAIGNKMGEWKLVHSNKAAVSINADLCVIDGKSNGAVFGVDYDWVKDEIAKNPDASRYTMTRNSCVTVGKVVQNPKLLGQLGEIVPTSRSIDLNVEFKRIYPEHPQTGRELLSGKIYNSTAPDVSMLEIIDLPIPDDELLTGIDDW